MRNFITNPEQNLGAIGLLNLSRFGFPRCDFRCHLLTYLLTNLLTDMLIFSRRWCSLKTGQGRDYVSGSKCVLYEHKTGNLLFSISILARRRREKIVYWVFSTGNPGKSLVNRNKFVTNLACIMLPRFSVHADMTFNFPCPNWPKRRSDPTSTGQFDSIPPV